MKRWFNKLFQSGNESKVPKSLGTQTGPVPPPPQAQIPQQPGLRQVNKKPETLKPEESWIHFHAEKNRVELDISIDIAEPVSFLGPGGSKYAFFLINLDKELLSYGILEKARQTVQNINDAKKFLEGRKEMQRLEARAKIMGGNSGHA